METLITELIKNGPYALVTAIAMVALIAREREVVRLRDHIDKVREGQLEQGREDLERMLEALQTSTHAVDAGTRVIDTATRIIEARLVK